MGDNLTIASMLVILIIFNDLEQGSERFPSQLEGIDINIGIYVDAWLDRVKSDNREAVVNVFEIVESPFGNHTIRCHKGFNFLNRHLFHNLITAIFQEETERKLDDIFIERDACFF